MTLNSTDPDSVLSKDTMKQNIVSETQAVKSKSNQKNRKIQKVSVSKLGNRPNPSEKSFTSHKQFNSI